MVNINILRYTCKRNRTVYIFIISTSSIYGFWLPLWCLQNFSKTCKKFLHFTKATFNYYTYKYSVMNFVVHSIDYTIFFCWNHYSSIQIDLLYHIWFVCKILFRNLLKVSYACLLAWLRVMWRMSYNLVIFWCWFGGSVLHSFLVFCVVLCCVCFFWFYFFLCLLPNVVRVSGLFILGCSFGSL